MLSDNPENYTLTIEDLIKAIAAGAPVSVIINGEYYDIKEVKT